MQNQKVYLAKSSLASGLDFEYVKSSLLRIPGIEVVEYGEGVNPSECAALIYVHDNVQAVQEDHALPINRNVYTAVEEFVSQTENGEAINGVFIYLGKSYSSPRDVEETTPFMIPASNFVVAEEPTWEEHGILVLEAPEGICLLESVSYAMGVSDTEAWEKYSRHHQPKEKYSLPPMPSIDERRSRGTSRILPSEPSTKNKAKPLRQVESSPRIEIKLTPKRKSFIATTPSSSFTMSADDIIKSRQPRRRT